MADLKLVPKSGSRQWSALNVNLGGSPSLNVNLGGSPSLTAENLKPMVKLGERDIGWSTEESFIQKDAAKFKELKETGGLLKPEQPGHVMAKLALDAPKDLNGKFLSWNDEKLAAFQE
ncbi:hypothetical protein KCU78_g7164, partial [Aureobasidium melanogenum]